MQHFNLFHYAAFKFPFVCSSQRNMVSDRLENVTQTISRLLEGYDIRLRPNFGGKYKKKLFNLIQWHKIKWNYIKQGRSENVIFMIY